VNYNHLYICGVSGIFRVSHYFPSLSSFFVRFITPSLFSYCTTNPLAIQTPSTKTPIILCLSMFFCSLSPHFLCFRIISTFLLFYPFHVSLSSLEHFPNVLDYSLLLSYSLFVSEGCTVVSVCSFVLYHPISF